MRFQNKHFKNVTGQVSRPNTSPSPKGTWVEICFERERHILVGSVFVSVAGCGLWLCVCTSGSWRMSSVFVYHTLPCFWGRVSHWTPELTNRSILSPKTFLSPGSSALGSEVHTGVPGLLCGCWGAKHMPPKCHGAFSSTLLLLLKALTLAFYDGPFLLLLLIFSSPPGYFGEESNDPLSSSVQYPEFVNAFKLYVSQHKGCTWRQSCPYSQLTSKYKASRAHSRSPICCREGKATTEAMSFPKCKTWTSRGSQ